MFNVLDDFSDIMSIQIDEREYFNFCNVTGTIMFCVCMIISPVSPKVNCF